MRKVFFIILFLSIIVNASDKVFTWECKFPTYSSNDGLHQSKNFNLIFKLDTISGKAYMEGNNGLGEVIPIYNKLDKSMSFIEITGGKNVMTTTITHNGNAVHSRNTVMFNELVASQYYGHCTVK